MGNFAKGQNQTTKNPYRFSSGFTIGKTRKKTHIQQIQSSRGESIREYDRDTMGYIHHRLNGKSLN